MSFSAKKQKERQARVDALCLNKVEQKQLTEYDRREENIRQQQKNDAHKFAWSSFTSVGLMSPIGAVNAVKNAQNCFQRQDCINKIANERNSLRQRAQERFERVNGICAEKLIDKQIGGECYAY